jgi:hypothetical protein
MKLLATSVTSLFLLALVLAHADQTAVSSGDGAQAVRIPPGQKHWHGATATTAMTHIALQDQVDGKTVDWMEKVSDEQYQGKPSAR